MTSFYIQQKLRPFGTARKAAATDAVDLKKTEFNPAYGRGRQEVQEQLVGFPGIMMRDFRNVPREQLWQEERERAKAIREAIKRKRQVVSPKILLKILNKSVNTRTKNCKRKWRHSMVKSAAV